MQMENFDLNLLSVLAAVLETRSVTLAAKRVGLTQPAVSHALARLRVALGDPLLVRVGQRSQLTDRATALMPAVRATLQQIEAMLTTPSLPTLATLKRSFVIDASDYTAVMLLPALTERLSTEAPGVTVTLRSHLRDAAASLEAGADVWIGVDPQASPALMSRRLPADEYACAVRKRHPFARRKPSLAEFAAARHLQIAPAAVPGGPLDDALAAKGLQRNVVMRVPQFLVAPALVQRCDLVLTAPRRLLERFSGPGLHLFAPPVAIPRTTVQVTWRVQAHEDPTHQWFRGLVHELLSI